MTGVLERYQQLIIAEELRTDTDQQAAAQRLDALQKELEAAPPRGSTLWKMLRRAPPPPRGLYMWGGVGRGKSMLMDLFFDSLDIRRKRRVHFHEFMIEVHDRLREARKSENGDPIPPVVADLADEARLLAFDEMVVNNMADAAIMSRLFTGLMDARVTVVTTSNRPPRDLYKNGLNRELFLPFIDLLEERLDVMTLHGPTDYSLERLGGVDMWYVPNETESTAPLYSALFLPTNYPPEDRAHVPTEDIDMHGWRKHHVHNALEYVAVFSFHPIYHEAQRVP